jgi:hypothetical protein
MPGGKEVQVIRQPMAEIKDRKRRPSCQEEIAFDRRMIQELEQDLTLGCGSKEFAILHDHVHTRK